LLVRFDLRQALGGRVVTSRSDTARGLTLVGASAGSGKTHRITAEVAAAVAPSCRDAISPEQLVAVTYTRRAAGELAGRIRKKLVEDGAFDKAYTLPLAYLGTVHSVCLRLVQEFAIEAGLSPKVDVLSGDELRWLREALEWGLPSSLREEIEAVGHRLELRKDHRAGRTDWLTPVQDIMTLARSNRISPERLPAMAQQSVGGLLALLPPPAPDAATLDESLLAALEDTARRLASVDDGVKKTSEVRETVERSLRDARVSPLPWPAWVKLTKLDPAKPLRHLVAPLVDAASAVERHPRLHDDIRAMTTKLFEAARLGLEACADWKRHRRVVDYVDMIDRALSLLDEDSIAEELRRRLRLLVVDELQDTSPIQLALFARLHRIIGRSTWVGDRKQCIFEFAGADPALMEAVTSWVAREGGDAQRLGANWRSRTELVDACSHVFSTAFERHGYEPADVAVAARRSTVLGSLPPFGVWTLAVKNADDEAEAVAEGVRRLLERPAETSIVDRRSGEIRPLVAGDVAVLVATNREAEMVTRALARRGIRATVARAGLMTTPEGTLVRAALGIVVDPTDTLSPAIIESLLGFEGGDPDAWLGARLARREDFPASPTPARLVAIRPELEACSPSEALDRVMHAVDLAAICRRWPDPEQRAGNIDALRSLTAKYEERCTRLHEAATLAGLVRFLDEASERVIVRDEERANDEQHVGSDGHGVTIATYHKAKGLEWPVVILGSLDREPRHTAFEVSPETDSPTFEPDDPLGGRWIRYWPWPFGLATAPLGKRAEQSATGMAVAQREERERLRLLYVGFTRARDHLVLAARAGTTCAKVQWLDEMRDESGPLITLSMADAAECDAELVLRGRAGSVMRVPARRWLLGTGGDEPARLSDGTSPTWFADAASDVAPGDRLPYWISPSSASTDWSELPVSDVAERARIGARLPLARSHNVGWNLVGDALHAFLAADHEELSGEQRLRRAERILAASEARMVVSVDALLVAGDQLRAWIGRQWPGARWHREYPVTGVIADTAGARRVRGTIDLLLELDDGVVVLDHKSYPGPAETWGDKARELAPQLNAYGRILEMGGNRILGKWIHFSIGGGAVRVT